MKYLLQLYHGIEKNRSATTLRKKELAHKSHLII